MSKRSARPRESVFETLARLAALEGIAVTAAMTVDDVADRLAEKWNREPIPGVVAVIEFGGVE
jgi:hypothetical protein